MANLFTFWDNGSWEASPVTTANQNPGFTPHPLTLSSDFAFAGANSGKIQAAAADPWRLLAMLCVSQGYSFVARQIVFTNGKKYKIKCQVYTPSASPIGTDNLPIVLTGDSLTVEASAVYVGTTVADCKDTWKEISFEFIFDSTKSIFADFSINGLSGAGSFPNGMVKAGNITPGGKLYIDEVSVEEVVACTLSYDNPAFDKTDCTTIANNDGTITVHASTTNGPLQYRLGAGAWQLSNVFNALTPGTYAIDIKDTTACTLPTVNATILAFNAPPPPTGGTLIIDEKPLTDNNFVAWFEATSGTTGFDKVDCINHHWDLPKPYDEIRKKTLHTWVVAQNEQFTFYTNFDTPLPATLDFTKLRLGLARNTGMVNMNLAALQKDENDDGTYNVYASATINTTVPEGDVYFLVIYNSDTFDILFATNRLQVMTEDNANTFTVRLQYRHSNFFYNYHFERLNSLLLQIRMKMANVEEQTEATLAQYRAVSNGKLRNSSFDLDKYVKLETYYYDIHGIRGMYSFQAMETIIVNDKNYVLRTAYKTVWSTKGLNVHKGSIELYEQEFSTQNKYGNPSTITIIGSDDSLLQADNGYLIKI